MSEVWGAQSVHDETHGQGETDGRRNIGAGCVIGAEASALHGMRRESEGVVMAARKRSALTQMRRDLYLTQRAIGDVQAVQRGTIVKRLARRSLVRSLFRALR